MTPRCPERVRKRGSAARALALATALAAAACSAERRDDGAWQLPPPPETPLARVGERVITAGEFDADFRELFLQARSERFAPLTPADYPAFLRRLVDLEILGAHAERQGLTTSPEVEARLARRLEARARTPDEVARLRRRLAAQLLVEQRVAAGELAVAAPDEAALRGAYEAARAEFVRPERVRVWVVRVAERERAERLAAEARALAPGDDAGFADLAQDYAVDDATRRGAGLSGWLERGGDGARPEVLALAFALRQPGDVADPIASEGGFAVVRLASRTPAIAVSFEDARPLLERRLRRRAFDAAVSRWAEELSASLRVEVYADALGAFLRAVPPPPDALP